MLLSFLRAIKSHLLKTLVVFSKSLPEFSVGPLEGLKVGLIGLGPLNWVGQKVRILFWGASPSFWVLNQFSQVIRGVISENISYILLVQGKELIRWIDVKHGKTSIEVLSSVILSFGCYLNISEGWIVKTSNLVIVVFLSSCVAKLLNSWHSTSIWMGLSVMHP